MKKSIFLTNSRQKKQKRYSSFGKAESLRKRLLSFFCQGVVFCLEAFPHLLVKQNYSKKKKVKQIVKFVFLSSFCLGGVWGSGIIIFGEQSPFRVEKIRFLGGRELSESELYQASGIQRYQSSMFTLDCELVARNLEKLVWVDRVQVKRSWPSELVIRIWEKRTIARVVGESGEQLYLTKSATIFSPKERDYFDDLPVITGVEKLSFVERDAAFQQVVLFLKNVAKENPSLPLSRISELHFLEADRVILYLVDSSLRIYMSTSDMQRNYKHLVRVLDDIYRRSSRISLKDVEYIQMDYMKDRVLVVENRLN